MWAVVSETWRILNEAAVYLLLGFALAGVLHWLVGRRPGLFNSLSKRGTKSVFLAALFGLPVPLCSCGVLPAGLALRKKGASLGATVAFLISVPETDIVSISLTYGLLGPVMAVFRPFAALVTAVVTGLVTNLVERWSGPLPTAAAENQAEPDRCAEDRRKGALREIVHYGFVEFFDDIIGALLFGIILGGLITVLLPSLGMARVSGHSFFAMLAMLAVGIPMYVCASASTPIAAGLIAGGFSPGAALVFLLAGPATNVASLVVLSKHLGRTILAVYLLCIALISVLMGLWLDAFIGSATIPLPAILPPAAESSLSIFKLAGALLFTVLSVMSLRRTGLLNGLVARAARRTGLPLSTRAVTIAAVILAGAVYAGSGVFVVHPGERAVETRFGRIVRSDLSPGLHYAWPYPVGRREIVPVARVQRLELGFRLNAPPTTPAASAARAWAMTAESWMLTGNEDIIDVKWVVQYQVRDSPQGRLDYLYGTSDPAQLVRSAAEASIRAAVGCRDIDTLLTTARATIEETVQRDWLQPALDRCRAGVRVLGVSLIDVHAPPDVHRAFRDVASAAEEKMETIHTAYEYQERVVRQAAGEAAQRVAQAEGQASDTIARAQGAGVAFGDRLEAYRGARSVTRRRMYFETMDAVLAGLRKYIRATGPSGPGLDLWRIEDQAGSEPPFLPGGGAK
jgi:HflK protein